jgi:hypothetical protein
MQMTWAEVCGRRLARHGLAQPVAAERLAEQVSAMGGVHAQIMAAAELSIGRRVAGITRAAVREALWTTHSLVKTYGPRGTVHLLSAQDLPLWTGALSAIRPLRTLQAQFVVLTPEQTAEVVEAIGEILAKAELTLDELNQALGDRLGAWATEKVIPAFQDWWPRWRQAMDTAAYAGKLCFGPNRGRLVTYTNPAHWLPGFQPAEEATALPWLLRRYLYAYGPATPQHFAQWLSAPRSWAQAQFEALPGELESVEVDGSAAWQLAGDAAQPSAAPTGVRLLPYFDAYVVGCHPRDKVFPGRAAERALARGQAGNYPVLLVNGIVAGLWHQRRSGSKLAITVEPFGRLSAAQRRELDQQVTRTGEIMEGKATLTIGAVTVGPHA